MSSELLKRPLPRGVPSKPQRGRQLCAKQKKRRYRSKGGAKSAAAQFAPRYGSTYRVYLCPHCRGWHLTTSGEGE